MAKPRPLHSLRQTVNIRGHAVKVGDISQEAIGDFGDRKIKYHLQVT